MTHHSASVVFRESAKELISRLSVIHHPAAWTLQREAEEILNAFEMWEHYPPLSSERVRVISRLLGLHRRVMDFLVNK